MSGQFVRWTDDDLADLIAGFPLAWVVCADARAAGPTPLPMLAERDAEGRVVALIGHFARSNPQVAALTADPRALFLFQGPQGYVSPEYVPSRDWAPTWNYAVARIAAEVRFDEDLTGPAIEKLVDAMEAGRTEPWSVAEMGERYERLKRAVIGFRAEIRSVNATFKLGQDERPEVLASIVARMNDRQLAGWMQRFDRAGEELP